MFQITIAPPKKLAPPKKRRVELKKRAIPLDDSDDELII